ncbi:MAG: hypothetical protein JSW53_02805 [Candidatus Bathyarchaeota archaeon]|nr:MAG: hypothetical protein JSW53_02805 [Candidatus Bathyarchaeota archaeon]
METSEWKDLVDKLKVQWKMLWRERMDDKVRAEGIASQDYSELFVERGLVIVASKDYRPLFFGEILQQHIPPEVSDRVIPPNPSTGGWRRFIKTNIGRQRQLTKRGRPIPQEFMPKTKKRSQKSEKGWLHFKLRD